MGLSCGALKLHFDYDPAPIIIPFITLPFCVCVCLSLPLFISFSLPLQYKTPSLSLYRSLYPSSTFPCLAHYSHAKASPGYLLASSTKSHLLQIHAFLVHSLTNPCHINKNHSFSHHRYICVCVSTNTHLTKFMKGEMLGWREMRS
ncbi:unnamed protein product [Prunus armeniaca]